MQCSNALIACFGTPGAKHLVSSQLRKIILHIMISYTSLEVYINACFIAVNTTIATSIETLIIIDAHHNADL